MGWYQIASVRTGKPAYFEGEFKSWLTLVSGERPADVMTNALGEIIELYKEAYGRKPKRRELEATFNLCADALELEE